MAWKPNPIEPKPRAKVPPVGLCQWDGPGSGPRHHPHRCSLWFRPGDLAVSSTVNLYNFKDHGVLFFFFFSKLSITVTNFSASVHVNSGKWLYHRMFSSFPRNVISTTQSPHRPHASCFPWLHVKTCSVSSIIRPLGHFPNSALTDHATQNAFCSWAGNGHFCRPSVPSTSGNSYVSWMKRPGSLAEFS